MFCASSRIEVSMPTTSPRRLNSGPPELPGLMGASVWNKPTPAPVRARNSSQTLCLRAQARSPAASNHGMPRARTGYRWQLPQSPGRGAFSVTELYSLQPISRNLRSARSEKRSLATIHALKSASIKQRNGNAAGVFHDDASWSKCNRQD